MNITKMRHQRRRALRRSEARVVVDWRDPDMPHLRAIQDRINAMARDLAAVTQTPIHVWPPLGAGDVVSIPLGTFTQR